jgi:2-methylisocitrate lyase-like PEP mutase family enzyme
VLNARVDVYIQRQGSPDEQTAEGLRRARLYRDAGADCVYPILQSDESILAQYVEAVGPINVFLRLGGPLSLQQAAAIGVRRVTYATSLFRATMTHLEGLAASIKSEADELL